MPFTPFHLGYTLFLGAIFQRYISIAAVLLASVFIDIRAIYCFFLSDCQLHGILHTYLGATLFAFGIALIVYLLRNKLSIISDQLHLYQSYSKKSIVLGSLIGAWSHVFFDSFMHRDLTPFFPHLENPFLGMINNEMNYTLAVIFFAVGLVIVFRRFELNKTINE